MGERTVKTFRRDRLRGIPTRLCWRVMEMRISKKQANAFLEYLYSLEMFAEERRYEPSYNDNIGAVISSLERRALERRVKGKDKVKP